MASIWYPCLNLINEIQKLQFPPPSEIRLYLSPRLRYELVTGVVEILRAWAIKWAQLHFCGLSGSEDIPPQSWNIFFYEIGIFINIINCPSIQLAILDQSWGKKISGHYLRYFWHIWREKHVCHDNRRELLIPCLKALCSFWKDKDKIDKSDHLQPLKNP